MTLLQCVGGCTPHTIHQSPHSTSHTPHPARLPQPGYPSPVARPQIDRPACCSKSRFERQAFGGDGASIAVCIVGQVPRIFTSVEKTMYANVIEPFGEHAHVFMVVSGRLTQPPIIPIRNLTTVAPFNGFPRNYKTQVMGNTFTGCHSLITAAEKSVRQKYEWIIRLRTDGLYLFTWSPHSLWGPRVGGPVVYTTHCVSGRPPNFKDNDCAGHAEQPCLSD